MINGAAPSLNDFDFRNLGIMKPVEGPSQLVWSGKIVNIFNTQEVPKEFQSAFQAYLCQDSNPDIRDLFLRVLYESFQDKGLFFRLTISDGEGIDEKIFDLFTNNTQYRESYVDFCKKNLSHTGKVADLSQLTLPCCMDGLWFFKKKGLVVGLSLETARQYAKEQLPRSSSFVINNAFYRSIATADFFSEWIEEIGTDKSGIGELKGLFNHFAYFFGPNNNSTDFSAFVEKLKGRMSAASVLDYYKDDSAFLQKVHDYTKTIPVESRFKEIFLSQDLCKQEVFINSKVKKLPRDDVEALIPLVIKHFSFDKKIDFFKEIIKKEWSILLPKSVECEVKNLISSKKRRVLDLLVQEMFWLVIAVGAIVSLYWSRQLSTGMRMFHVFGLLLSVVAVVQGADRLSGALNQYDALKDAFDSWLRKCADAVDGGLELYYKWCSTFS